MTTANHQPTEARSLHLRPQDKTRLLALLKTHLPDVTAWAYGSRVNGRSHDGSDLDLVLRSPDLSPIDIDSLLSFIEAIRDSNIPILIDARDWARLPEGFHREIERAFVSLN
jgi:predicted nucleotidyltransferase